MNFLRKLNIILVLLAFSALYMAAQETPPEEEQKKSSKKRSVKYNLSVGDQLFGLGELDAAKTYYLEAAERDPESIYAYNRLAEIARYSRYYNDAVTYYNMVVGEQPRRYPLSRFWLGMMQKATGRYDDAKNSFLIFLEEYKGKEIYYQNKASKEIMACDEAKKIIKNPVENVNIQNIGEVINGNKSDYGAVLKDERTIYFTGTIKSPIGSSIKVKGFDGVIDSVYMNRIFFANLTENGWTEREILDLQYEGQVYQLGNPVFASDKALLYMTICKNINGRSACKIYTSSKDSLGNWTAPQPLNSEINVPGYSSKHPMFVSHGHRGDLMFFSSSRPGGFGGFDIWYCHIKKNGKTDKPVNLGSNLNTYDDEITPFYDEIHNMFYFSSNGHLGLGGFDIYKVKGSIHGIWDRPVNMGFPFNTNADDYYFNQYETNKGFIRGFLSSNRSGGYALNESVCCDDIYVFQSDQPKKEKKPQLLELAVTGYVMNSQAAGNNSTTKSLLTNLEGGSGKTLSARASLTGNSEDTRTRARELLKQFDPEVTGIDPEEIIVADIQMQEIKLPYVYFKQNQFHVSPTQKEKVDSIVQVLKNYPDLIDELGTFQNSSDSFSTAETSNTRKQSILDYITSTEYRKSNLHNALFQINDEHTDNGYPNFNGEKPEASKYQAFSTIEMLTMKEVKKNERDTKIYLTKVVLPVFYYDFSLKDISYKNKEKLNEIVQVMDQHPEAILEFHTYTEGDETYRAHRKKVYEKEQRIIEYFNTGDIPGTRLDTVSQQQIITKKEQQELNRTVFKLYEKINGGILLSDIPDPCSPVPQKNNPEIPSSDRAGDDQKDRPKKSHVITVRRNESYSKTLNDKGDKEVEDLSFKIQVGVFGQPQPEKFSHLKAAEQIETLKEDDLLFHFIGDNKKWNEAKQLKNEIIEQGIKDAFIVAFYKGNRISLSEAADLLEKQQ